ncbi:MAG: PIG-L deacetylase family protein [Aggregatilineales bacterium]
MMTDQAQPPIERAMAIFAHPDDPEFFAGGLLAKLGSAGKRLIYVLATSGDKGSDEADMISERLVEIREAEQRAAARCAGAKPEDVIFLRQPDGELMPDLKLRRILTRVIRQQKPDVIVTNDPMMRYSRFGGINHPDHVAIGHAVLDSVYPTARDRLNMIELWRDEGLDTHKVRYVYLAGSMEPNVKVDITPVFDRKIAAIAEHRSQVKDPAAMEKRMREGRDSDYPDYLGDPPRYTESYRVLRLG